MKTESMPDYFGYEIEKDKWVEFDLDKANPHIYIRGPRGNYGWVAAPIESLLFIRDELNRRFPQEEYPASSPS